MTREAVVFYSEFDDPAAWGRALTKELPDVDFRVAPEIGDPKDVRYVLAVIKRRVHNDAVRCLT